MLGDQLSGCDVRASKTQRRIAPKHDSLVFPRWIHWHGREVNACGLLLLACAIDDIELEKLDALIVAAESDSSPVDLNIQQDLANNIDIGKAIILSDPERESNADF